MAAMSEASNAGGSALPLPNDASAREEIRERAETVLTRGAGGAPAVARRKAVDLRGAGGRVALVAGVRTPFLRTGGAFKGMDVVDLAAVVAGEVVARTGIDPTTLGLSVFGCVAPSTRAPNLGREALLRAGLPPSVPGLTVSLACASSCEALVAGARTILAGEHDAVLAGGAESLSNIPVTYSRNAAQGLRELSRARSVKAKLAVLSRVRFKDLVPVPPTVSEFSTGMTLGEAGEKMARENDVGRRAQDEIALTSHQRAQAATEDGRLGRQIVPVIPRPDYDQLVERDGAIRPETSAEALATLEPAYDRRFGSLTAGNACPLTDGAAAFLLMSEERAKAEGYEPLGYLRAHAVASLDPGAQLLQGAAYAIPQALDRAGLSLADVDLVEMHEAFGAQVISNLKALASTSFARHELGREKAVGEVDLDRLNVTGGSIALGHPFGATGARLALQLLHELQERDLGLGLLAVSAAGGIGYALVLERG